MILACMFCVNSKVEVNTFCAALPFPAANDPQLPTGTEMVQTDFCRVFVRVERDGVTRPHRFFLFQMIDCSFELVCRIAGKER